MLSDLRYRLRSLFRRGAMERELEAELRFHLEREIEKHVRSGLAWKEAERRARLEFGGLEVIREEARDARGVGWIDMVMQDLRYAWRGLRAKPAFAAGVVLTLGLGTGANTAMFGIVDRLLLRPPAALREAGRVHRVYVSYLWDGRMRTERNFEFPRFLDVSRSVTSFDATTAFQMRRLAVGTGEGMREMNVLVASASMFDLFESEPVMGRFFDDAEDALPAGDAVVVLSHAYWQSAFGGDNAVLGETLNVGNGVYTVIGVAPPGLTGFSENAVPALFIPITKFAWTQRPADFATDYGWSWLELVVRRKPGVSVAAAHADLTMAWTRSWEAEREKGARLPPAADARLRAEVASVLLGRGPLAGPEARVVAWVMGVAVIVLLIACANVVNLLLARSVHRRREIALRLALGVSRTRLMQQLMTETLLLAVLGGALGLAVAQWGGRTMRSLFLPDGMAAVAGDRRTVLFVATITLLLALLTGLAPAWQAIRADVAGALKAGSRDTGYRRSVLRSGLLLFQGVFSVVLLVGAGLFVRSLQNVHSLRLGYDVDPVLVVEPTLRGVELNLDGVNALVDRGVAAALSVPGVHSATPAASIPFWSNEGRGAPYVEGRDSLARLGRFILQAGSPAYFETLGTRILRGRGFTSDDRAGAPPVVVVSQTMAEALWPGADAVGQRMRIGADTMPFLTVVGVAESMRARRLEGDAEFWYFLPIDQYRMLFGAPVGSLIVRVNGKADDYVEALRARLQREMPGTSYVSVLSLRTLVAPQQRAWQFGATMFVAFAALALALAAIGLYSVVAYAVASRTRELGVRMALGASVAAVARQVVGQGVAFAVAGIVIGGGLAMAAARWVEPLLFDTPARDPLVFATVTGILLVVALLATLRPALRATRVDPTLALRAE